MAAENGKRAREGTPAEDVADVGPSVELATMTGPSVELADEDTMVGPLPPAVKKRKVRGSLSHALQSS